jgi:putative toxin-antitoxin system antitoxin component (TIGR02293 family)
MKKDVHASIQFGGLLPSGIQLRGSKDSNGSMAIGYVHDRGVDDFVLQVHLATPIQLVEAERNGVDGRFLKDLSKRIDMPAARVFTMLGVPRATAEKKATQGAIVSGSGGQAAIAVAKLLGKAKSIVENSTSPEAKGFDSAKWLGQWLERPQPALGGRKPADLIDTPTGVEIVTKLLGAIESGAYQ